MMLAVRPHMLIAGQSAAAAGNWSEGDLAQAGRTTGADWVLSKVLTPMYAAAQKNNEL
jgi:hypothetical protein